MTRGEFKRECAYAESLIDPVTALLKARLPSIVAQAIGREFTDPPIALVDGTAPSLQFEARAVLETARGILAAAQEWAALEVARAVGARLAAGDAEKWLEAKRKREARALREFEGYQRDMAREHLERAEARARVTRIKTGSIATRPVARRESVVSLERAALRERLAALRLPRVQ